jgi:hypothetical protein
MIAAWNRQYVWVSRCDPTGKPKHIQLDAARCAYRMRILFARTNSAYPPNAPSTWPSVSP